MCCASAFVEGSIPKMGGIFEAVRKALAEQGIDFESLCRCEEGEVAAGGKARVKVVCVAPTLKESVQEMGAAARDQVVMVRVDEGTARTLDAWVETGAVRSRSEAAALFIREGMKVRASELERLRDALKQVQDARERLRREAREAFGLDEEPGAARGA